ncbi:hypothetical protein AAFF_G00006860 [Aldrovandia affinis]|uniref:Uncharacterized protein n=1 Tax=Aldrovandia affinis TaxID=143900 RepID=A0AAD7X3R8_9TELE|nr:hypothetical protein AAFF_G00006860 [Aldrovandia affinis]
MQVAGVRSEPGESKYSGCLCSPLAPPSPRVTADPSATRPKGGAGASAPPGGGRRPGPTAFLGLSLSEGPSRVRDRAVRGDTETARMAGGSEQSGHSALDSHSVTA